MARILDLVTIDNRSTVLEQDTMSSANGFNSLVQLSIRFIPTLSPLIPSQ